MSSFKWPVEPITVSGVALETTQQLVLAEVQAINANTADVATETTLAALAAEDFATETTLAALAAEDFATETTLAALAAEDFATETTLANVEAALSLTPVDQIDTTPLLDLSSTNIPASGSNPQEVVASTAATVRKIVSVEDTGEYIGVYTGAALSEVLLCILPLGGGEMQVNVPAGTRISLRNMKNAAIASGFLALNLLG